MLDFIKTLSGQDYFLCLLALAVIPFKQVRGKIKLSGFKEIIGLAIISALFIISIVLILQFLKLE